jgi:glycosyltransferase involved in cell wall biosynthesis
MSFDTGLDYAVFVDSYDVQGMAEAIIRIINDRKLVQRLRHRGPKLIQEKFHARIVAQKLEQIIQKYQSD